MTIKALRMCRTPQHVHNIHIDISFPVINESYSELEQAYLAVARMAHEKWHGFLFVAAPKIQTVTVVDE